MPSNSPQARPHLYQISSVMEKLQVSRSTVYRMVERGELELINFGPYASRITSESLHRLIENGSTNTSQPTNAGTPQLLYRVINVMKMLDASRSTVYRLIDRGELERVNLSPTSVRISAESLHQLIERGTKSAN